MLHEILQVFGQTWVQFFKVQWVQNLVFGAKKEFWEVRGSDLRFDKIF